MRRRVIRLLLVTVALGVVLVIVRSIRIQLVFAQYYQCSYVVAALKGYIADHSGRFPASETDLEESGYLKTETSSGSITYRVRTDAVYEGPIWPDVPRFEDFDIAYGVAADQLFLRGRTLHSKRTNQPVLLIDGPNREEFQEYKEHVKTYSELSVELYEDMLRWRSAAASPLPTK